MNETVIQHERAHDFDPGHLTEGLRLHGLLLPSGVPGVAGYSATFEDVLHRFDALVLRTAADDEAEHVAFPPVMSRRVLERVQYFQSFPHLCGVVYAFSGTERQAHQLAERTKAGEPWSDFLGMAEVVLVPAACYPMYPSLTGTVPECGRLLTSHSWVYRHEVSAEPTRLQSFRIREFVRVGTRDQCQDWRDGWSRRAQDLLLALGLPVTADWAADPFFGRSGKLLAVGQKEQRLKIELRVPVWSETEPTAICSFNLHQDHFSSLFDIRLDDGRLASTACLGFGLERIAIALFQTHGFDPAGWPDGVRQLLWP